MSKTFAFAGFTALLLLAGSASAATPVVDQRQANQHARIDQGVASGELTRREATALRAQQAHVRHDERAAKADGVVTPQERRHLRHEQNKSSKTIRRQKHDAQER